MVRIISPFLCFIVETPRVGRITVPQIRPRSNARYLLACSVQFSRSVASDYLWPHELQHTRVPCPSPTPGACSNSCPSSQWYYPTISSSSAGKDRKAGEEGDNRRWDGWISWTWWTWVWASSRSWWWTGKPGLLQSRGSQRVRHDWETQLTDWISWMTLEVS